VHLTVWAGVALLVILARPVHFSLQFLVGMGLPLLALGAFGLARAPRPVLPAVALAFAASQLVLTHFLSEPRPLWLVPRAEMDLARALRPACRPGDVLFAPPTLGLLTYGLTPCRAFLSHRVDPGYEERLGELRAFSTLRAEERSALLDRYRITHLVLPGQPGPAPSDWLGGDTPFRRSEIAAGTPLWTLYVRARP
jgi:hypothetical protein